MRKLRHVPDVPAEIVARLENWGAYYRDRPSVGISITGIICERLARSKGQIEAARTPRAEIDQADAQLVNRAWQSPLMPAREKALLRAQYALGLHYRNTCRLLRMWHADYAREHWRAVVMIRRLIVALDVAAEKRAQSAPIRSSAASNVRRMREQASAPAQREITRLAA